MTLETRLGMFTIVILVFTFGFLVYRKVDLHHQKLTQAAIGPQTEDIAADSPPERPADAELSSAAVSFPAGLDEPLSMAQSNSFLEHDPKGIEASVADFPAPDQEQDSAPALTFNDAPTEFAATDLSGVDADITDTPDVSREPAPELIDFFADAGRTQTGVNDAFDQSSDASIRSLQRQEATAPEFETSKPDEAEPAATDQPEPEPMLIAMLEPVQSSDAFGEKGLTFDGGLTPVQEDSVRIRSPSAAAVADVPHVEVTEPFFPEPDESSKSKNPTSSSQNDSPFYTTPLNDASPSHQSPSVQDAPPEFRKTPVHRVSPAIARTADGKFSLAAFNYQNNAESPVDDGNQYEVTVVQPGDNYTTISRRVYGSIRYFSALAVFNQHRIPDPRKMRPGMKVLIPAAEVLEERYPLLFPELQNTQVQPAGFFLLEDGSPAFRVGGRETLSEISERFLGRSSRWTEIYRLNRTALKDPNKLKPGLVLALPADAVEVNVAP